MTSCSKIAVFTGYSDDTFGCYSDDFDVDRDNCANGHPIEMIVSVDELDRLLVVGHYDCDGIGTWRISVQPLFEGGAFDDLQVSMRGGDRVSAHSPTLTVVGPEEMDVRMRE